MNADHFNDDRDLDRLIDRMCDQIASADELAALGRRLAEDPAARDHYIACLELHARLAWQMAPGKPFSPEELFRYAGEELTEEGLPAARDAERGMAGSPAIDAAPTSPENVGSAVELPNRVEAGLPISGFPLSPLAPPSSPFSPPFVGGPVFSYLVATVILAVMLLSAWAYKVTRYQQIAGVDVPSGPSGAGDELVFVGRITGAKNCRWADPHTQAYLGSAVPLGRKYALASGLMEISYYTGAKVILEGPCTYQVESRAGGYLALGKLTARIVSTGLAASAASGMRSEARGRNPRPKTQDLRPQSEISKSPSSFIPHPSPLFAVRTPTAVVTDLGTEFGVEVSKEGNTTSFVFRGSVKVQTIGNNLPSSAGRGVGGEGSLVLRANESARVEKDAKTGAPRIVAGAKAGETPKFARRIYEPPKQLDLLDIVAGGDGTGHRRESGIDPTSGWQDPSFVAETRRGDGTYRPVTWNKLIDGVVVPARHAERMQLDSAGHVFELTAKNAGVAGMTHGSIWARSAEIAQPKLSGEISYWVYSMGVGEQFMPDRRGLLCIHANAAITFDLDAMRKTFKEARPSRLRSVVGLADARPLYPSARAAADVWVFVDGRLKFQHPDLRWRHGAVGVDVEIGRADRFLTLAVTDPGGGHTYVWVVFGDPVLEMTPASTKEREEVRPK